MEILWTRDALATLAVDLVAVTIFASENDAAKDAPGRIGRGDGGVELDTALSGALSNVLARGEFRGEVDTYRLCPTYGKLPSRYVALVGAGSATDFSLDTVRRLGNAVYRAAKEVRATTAAAVVAPEAIRGIHAPARVQAFIEGLVLGSYRFEYYKISTRKSARAAWRLDSLRLVPMREQQALAAAAQRGKAFAEATNLVRDLVNQPGNICTPEYLAEQATLLGRRHRLECTVFLRKEIVANRMHLLHAVAQGMTRSPAFVHLRYTPPKKPKARIALIGKGVTFDTGGYDLKPSKHMEHMKSDMAGAGAVLGAMQLAALYRPAVAVDAYLPCTENVVDGKSHRAGDIVTARNGKTIELVNMDAEGRLILADAIDYALEHRPDYLIDLATLTGGVQYALGEFYTAVLGNDQPLINRLLAAGKTAGERMWQLPLERDYLKGFTTGPADLRNIGKTAASTISGALFLEQFVGKVRWAHFDIATSSWCDDERAYTPRGGTGVGARTLAHFLLSF